MPINNPADVNSFNFFSSMPINNPADVNSFNNVLQSLNHENDYPTLMKNPGKGKSSTSSGKDFFVFFFINYLNWKNRLFIK